MSSKNNQQQFYDQEQVQGVAHNDDSQLQDEGSQQYNQQSENHNLRYQQNNKDQQGHQQNDFIQNEEPQEEERVVRAQNQRVQDNYQQLFHQTSSNGGLEFQKQGSFNNDQYKQQQNGGIQRQPSLHQQKLQQEQQNFQAQQQQTLLQKQKSQSNQIGFSQFLNELLDQYKSTSRAFKAIDKHNKGFIELNDLGTELTQKFGIESESQHKQIFVKLGHGNERITREIFDASFEDIVRDRQQQQQKQVLSTMNVVTQSYDPRQSPFKDKTEREEIINIFSSNQQVNLEETNKIEHFDDSCKYAPVVRRLRQQPTFNEFVRQYNSLQFPKYQQPQSSGVQQPISLRHPAKFSSNEQIQNKQQLQQLFLNHELFAQPSARTYRGQRGAQKMLDEFRSSSPPLKTLQSGSPLRSLKISAHTFSPSRYFKNFESPKVFTMNKNPNNLQRLSRSQSPPLSSVLFLSPQYNRKPNQNLLGQGLSPHQSQIHGNQLKQSQGNFNNFNSTLFSTARNPLNNSRHFVSQDSDLFQRSNVGSPSSGTLTFGSANPLFQSLTPVLNYNKINNQYETQSPKLAKSTYLQADQKVDLKISPTQNRLKQLKKQVNDGLESISSLANKPRMDYNSNVNSSQYNSNYTNKATKDQLNQYLSMLGSSKSGYSSIKNIQSSPQRLRGVNKSPSPLKDENDGFRDILSRLSGTGSRSNLRSLDKKSLNKQNNFDVFEATKSSPFRSNSMKRSRSPVIQLKISPTYGGIHGQMQRVRQIQASLRQIPQRQIIKASRNDSRNKNNNYNDKKKNVNN